MQLCKRVRVMGVDRTQIRELLAIRYKKGESIRELAESLGRSYGFVHRLLSEADGVEIRGRGGNTRAKRR